MPTTFEDKKGNKYTLTLTLSSVRDIQTRLPIDILNDQDWRVLMGSLVQRLAYVWWHVKDQAEGYGLDLDAWEMNITAPGVADEVGDALLTEMVSFYRSLGQKKLDGLTDRIVTGLKIEREKFSDPKTMAALDALITGATSQS
jgi:hypothetical protein